MTAYRKPLMFIAGIWTGGDGAGRPVTDPATGAQIGMTPGASPQDLAAALAAAQRGFACWRDTPPEDRCAIMMRAAELLRARAEQIAPQVTLEQGKPLAEARQEVLRAADLLEWDANEGRRNYGRIIPAAPGLMRYALMLPIGPVAAFTPWNFPVSSPVRKLGAALGAGCSVILKAAEETPVSAMVVVEALLDAGLPPEVVNLVFGDPQAISTALIEAPQIRAISFTGSVPVGKRLAAMAAEQMKPALMELGGHAPVIVCADADVATVARQAVAAKFRNAGQICVCPSRFIVERPVAEEFAAAMAAEVAGIRVGAGLDPATRMGPLANMRRVAAMTDLVADARTRGATVLCGGARLGDQGCFFAPTVLNNVPADARILAEEPFGPVAPIVAVADFDAAIQMANALPFGLNAYGFSRSQQRVERMVREVESGMMSINHFGSAGPEAPFGGIKDSGYGREGGFAAMAAFSTTKFVMQQFSG